MYFLSSLCANHKRRRAGSIKHSNNYSHSLITLCKLINKGFSEEKLECGPCYIEGKVHAEKHEMFTSTCCSLCLIKKCFELFVDSSIILQQQQKKTKVARVLMHELGVHSEKLFWKHSTCPLFIQVSYLYSARLQLPWGLRMKWNEM